MGKPSRPSQSHYPDIEPTSPCPTLIMPNTWLGSDKYQFEKLLVSTRPWIRTHDLPQAIPVLYRFGQHGMYSKLGLVAEFDCPLGKQEPCCECIRTICNYFQFNVEVISFSFVPIMIDFWWENCLICRFENFGVIEKSYFTNSFFSQIYYCTQNWIVNHY